MARPEKPLPVKYLVAVLFREAGILPPMKKELISRWGAIDFEGQDHLFNATDYYQPEMGMPLFRRLLAFESLYTPALIVSMKLECNDIEAFFSQEGKRTVNLDAGYLDHNKLILASAKEAGQKVYLDNGIYADLCGRYKTGRYRPFEWSFPDFRDGRYDEELAIIRKVYMQQVKKFRSETGT